MIGRSQNPAIESLGCIDVKIVPDHKGPRRIFLGGPTWHIGVVGGVPLDSPWIYRGPSRTGDAVFLGGRFWGSGWVPKNVVSSSSFDSTFSGGVKQLYRYRLKTGFFSSGFLSPFFHHLLGSDDFWVTS